jgi:hypothetical protein
MNSGALHRERPFAFQRAAAQEAEGEWVVTTQEQSDILAQLEAPFATEEIKWRVTHTTKDAKKGAVIPYADQRAYTDRLNKVLTPSGWTREYIVTTVSNISRMVTRDKTIQTGKILVTCIVTIPGAGTHTGSGEEWADNENAMTSAEAQAFKRACSCFGLGRYFYDVREQWVELDDYKRPKQTPKLSGASTPAQRQQQGTERASNAGASRVSPKLATQIEGYKKELGESLFQEILTVIGKAQTARSLPSDAVANNVLQWMERGTRGIQKARDLGADLSVGEFDHVLSSQRIRSLNQVPTLKALSGLVVALEAFHGQPEAA